MTNSEPLHSSTHIQPRPNVRIDGKSTALQDRIFDLSVPLSRLLLLGWSVFRVIQIASGVYALERGTDILGFSQMACGLFFLLFIVLMPRANRYVIAFDDSHLTLEKALARTRKIPWASISEIEIQLMKLEIELKKEKDVTWNFNMSYTDNQIVKPQIIVALNEFAEANGIPVRDSRRR